MIFVLEGIPGAGKSTIKNLLQHDDYWKDSIFIPEIVDEKLLKKYLDNMKKEAYHFQCEIQRQTMQRLKAAAILAKQGYNVFIDRGMIGNSLFVKVQKDLGFITEEEYDKYTKEFSSTNPKTYPMEYNQLLGSVKIAKVYIKVKPEIAMKRIKKRSRNGESGYDIEYLKKLYNEHCIFEQNTIIIENNETIIDALQKHDPNQVSSKLKSSCDGLQHTWHV
tara:strand:- start:286 stop:945 length:660 start_codon:yes stop_codon:yes gene_type:complete